MNNTCIAPRFLAICCAAMTAASAFAAEISDGPLVVKSSLPETVRVGEQFNYDITVMNNSSDVTLHDVKLRQKPGDGFSIDKTSADQAKETEKSGNNTITMKRLDPGQSQTVSVTATADGEGDLKNCLEIVSYRPAVCLTLKAVKPQLDIVKNAPKRANRCEMIELTYTVKNAGTGTVGAFTVTDDLGDNVQTIEGNKKLSFDVSGLEAGQERSFIGRVFATEPGSFSSRAVAAANQSDLSARSKKTETRVVAPDLRVSLDGPQSLLNGQPAVFKATITNTGNAPATNLDVALHYPQMGDLLNVSDMSMKSSDQDQSSQSSSSQSGKQPTKANQSGSNKQAKQAADDLEMSSEKMAIETLQPGQSATFEYAISPNELTEIPTKVIASYLCKIDAADDVDAAKDTVEAMAMARAKVVRLPALQLIALDSTDPVPTDGNTTYMIRILNEGAAKDTNVKMSCELPKGLSFVSADGPTEANENGQKVSFGKIDELGPGSNVEFKVEAKADGSADGNVTFKVRVESDNRSEIIEEEPTTLFGK